MNIDENKIMVSEGATTFVIDSRNYRSWARELALPYCYFQNRLRTVGSYAGMPVLFRSDGSLDVAFYDIETDDSENFLFGYVNGRRFDNAADMCAEIRKHKIAVSFNGFRFDNRILFRLAPDNFFERDVGGGFLVQLFRECVNVDALFFYSLWRPFASSHKLDYLARDMGMDRRFSLEEKDKKCAEDVEIIKRFFPCMWQLACWFYSRFRLDPESLSAVNISSMGKIRRWCFGIWCLEHGIMPRLVRRKYTAEKARALLLARPGMYQDVRAYDVKSAYPNMVIRLNCGVHKAGDLAEFERMLLAERSEHLVIAETVKWICNAIIGDMNCTDGLLYDQKIMVDVWNGFRKLMEQWIERIGQEHVLYAHTDGLFSRLAEVPEFAAGFEVAVKNEFSWLVVYNQERLLGRKKNGSIYRVHFNHVPAQLKMYDYVERELDRMFSAFSMEELRRWLAKPSLPADFLRGLPLDAFRLLIRKDSNVCNVPEYFPIWADLRYGFNEVFYGSRGIVSDAKKLNYSRYNRLLKNYINLYRFKAGKHAKDG